MLRGPQRLTVIVTDLLAGGDSGPISWPTTPADHDERSKVIIREFTKFIIAENAIFTHQDKIALIAAGTDETNNPLKDSAGYEHLSYIAPFGVLENSEILASLDSASGSSPADLFSAIVLATECVSSYNQSLKTAVGTKRVFVVTAQNGCPIEGDGDEQTVGAHLRENNFELYLVNCGTGRDAKGIAMKELARKMNATFMGPDEINEYVLQPRKKRVGLTTKSRVGLNFGGHFEIPTFVYLGVKEETMPTPKSESIYGGGEGRAVMSRTYYVKKGAADVGSGDMGSGDIDTEVPQEERSRAYLYGKHLIPVGPAETALLAPPPSEKCLDVIGTVSKEKSYSLWLNRPAELIVPEPGNAEGYVALMCLLKALREKDLVLVARYVWRKNVPPKLCLISPSTDETEKYLILNYLPFAEDLKLELSLPVLPEPERVHQDAMNKLVSHMSLIKSMKKEGDEGNVFDDENPAIFEEYFDPKSVWNPALQLFYFWSMIKLARGSDAQLPPAPPRIIDTFEISDNVLNDSTLIETLQRLFPLDRVETRREAMRKQWQTAMQKKPGEAIDVDAIVSEADPSLIALHVSELEPKETFKAMVDLNDPDVTNRAFVEFADIVLDRAVEISHSPNVETLFLDLLGFHREYAQRWPHLNERHNTLLVRLADILYGDIRTYEKLIDTVRAKYGPVGSDKAGASESLAPRVPVPSTEIAPVAPTAAESAADLDELE